MLKLQVSQLNHSHVLKETNVTTGATKFDATGNGKQLFGTMPGSCV